MSQRSFKNGKRSMIRPCFAMMIFSVGLTCLLLFFLRFFHLVLLFNFFPCLNGLVSSHGLHPGFLLKKQCLGPIPRPGPISKQRPNLPSNPLLDESIAKFPCFIACECAVFIMTANSHFFFVCTCLEGSPLSFGFDCVQIQF